MFHAKVTLPESHPDYPSITQSQCGKVEGYTLPR
jgi:hypothetical protein